MLLLVDDPFFFFFKGDCVFSRIAGAHVWRQEATIFYNASNSGDLKTRGDWRISGLVCICIGLDLEMDCLSCSVDEKKSPSLTKCGWLSISSPQIVYFFNDVFTPAWPLPLCLGSKLVSVKIVVVNDRHGLNGHIVGFNCTRHIMSAHALKSKCAQHAPPSFPVHLIQTTYGGILK